MDAMSHLLRGVGAQGAFVLRCSLRPPWALRIADESPVSVVAPVRGDAWIAIDGTEPVLVRQGDVAVVRGPDHYCVADDPASPPQVRIDPGQVCVPLRSDVPAMTEVGVRTWGNAPAGPGVTQLLVGVYESRSTIGGRLLANLPALVVATRDQVPAALVDHLADQAARDEPGQDVVLDRLLDLVLVAVLRWWFAEQGPTWYRAHADPVVGHALRLMEAQPGEAWTVAGLAERTGLSRAAFARRFAELVGEPPMAFLTSWRLALAADLLREPGATVGSVARRVGYSTPYAFSTAFKRAHELSPRDHRELSP
ncbi:AraC family transcriptional regulator [Pseudonocardia ailaonensis]|uniref:AraC family transcriptional regulator n=1 Tax=Pseudonocardia ailaonensis TaxID=367279 RepID=A0ABN2NDL3_9PSEU